MNLARPAGAYPARPLGIDLEFGRARLFACTGVLAAINAQANQIVGALKYQPLLVAIPGLAGISAVIWFAMYVVLRIGFDGRAEPVSGKDPAILCAVVALSFLPISYAAQCGLLICAVYLLFTSHPGERTRRIAFMLLALTGPLVWGRILLHGFAAPLLGFDARIVGSVIGTQVDGNTVRFAGSAKGFLIGVPCSSVHNMSLAVVLWSTAAVLFRIRVDARYLISGFAMVALMFALNIARLAAIGLFPGSFEFLHQGAGAELFGWFGLIGAGSIAAVGVSSAVRRQR